MKLLLTFGSLLTLSAPAHADLAAWLTEVAAGTPASYSNTNVQIPTQEDIGTIAIAGGATYEFIVNATNAGASSALMGARNTGFGDNAAIKFEQWQDTMQFGVTEWAVADFAIAPNMENVDMHVVVVCDLPNNTCKLFVDGVLAGTAPYAPHLSAVQGLGEWYDLNGATVDPLTGMLLGVAAYDSMMPDTEIAAHAAAFFGGGGVGTNYCGPPVSNSTGLPALLTATGSAVIADNNLNFFVDQLPPNQFGYFVMGENQGFLSVGQGFLCMSLPFVRFNQNILNSGAGGQTQFSPDLANLPAGTVFAIGDTWNFQCWYRDVNPNNTSNLTDGVSIVFQ